MHSLDIVGNGVFSKLSPSGEPNTRRLWELTWITLNYVTWTPCPVCLRHFTHSELFLRHLARYMSIWRHGKVPSLSLGCLGCKLEGGWGWKQEVEQLADWCSLNNLELNTLKTVEMIVDFRRNPPTPPPHSPSWTALWLQWSHIQVPGNQHLSGPEVGQSHWLYREKGPAEAVFPPPAKEVQPASGAADTVLLCHHRVCPMLFYNCLVWFSYQNRHQKTTTDSQDCWEDYQELYTSRVRKRAKKVTLDPHTQLTLSLYCCPLAGATDHWAQKQPDTRIVFPPRPYPTWTTHNTPRYCTSVNNLSNLQLYIGHMHIHSSVYGHFSFCIFLP